MQFCLVETSIGTFGLGWTEAGVSRVALPGASAADAARLLQKNGGELAEPWGRVAEVEEQIVAYTEGEREAFADVALDLSGVPEFNLKCYADIRTLGWGETTTYGAIARRLGDVALSRAVGAAMGANPIPLIIPCHRVLAAAGRTGGFSAPGGVTAKMRMLALERATTPDGQYGFGF